jgi:hypothetical protein
MWLKQVPRLFVIAAVFGPYLMAGGSEKELGELLKVLYKGTPVVVMSPGFYAGEFKKSMAAREDFVNWRHYHESLPINREKTVLDQIDDHTFATPPLLGGNGLGSNIIPIAKGESMLVSNVLFGCLRAQCILTLYLNTAKLSKTVALDPRKETRDVMPLFESAGLGCEFQFLFSRQIIEQPGTEEMVVATISKYLQPADQAERSLRAQKDIEIEIGATEEEVIAKLGEPLKSIRVGSQKTLKYQDMTVTLKDGKVAEVGVK